MPRYDFRCVSCDQVFEVTRPAGSPAPEPCPACGAEAKRVFSPVGVVFKGSGFHNTDYKAKPKETDSSPACSSADSGSAKCASCPAGSAE